MFGLKCKCQQQGQKEEDYRLLTFEGVKKSVEDEVYIMELGFTTHGLNPIFKEVVDKNDPKENRRYFDSKILCESLRKTLSNWIYNKTKLSGKNFNKTRKSNKYKVTYIHNDRDLIKTRRKHSTVLARSIEEAIDKFNSIKPECNIQDVQFVKEEEVIF